jgi:hypothetical protein
LHELGKSAESSTGLIVTNEKGELVDANAGYPGFQTSNGSKR